MKEKTYFIILFSLFFVLICKRTYAQNGQIETKRTIHVATAGSLPNLISEDEKYQIEELTLTGVLNGTDLGFLREMAGKSRVGWCHTDHEAIVIDECIIGNTQGNLKILDISNVNIVSGGDSPFFVQNSNAHTTYIYSLDNIMPDYLFYSCRLISIKLPQSISGIGEYALSGCPISSINITDGVTFIGARAFLDCSNLASITVDSGNTKYDSRDNCNAIIEKPSNTLVVGCKKTIIPNNVTSIGNSAFEGCSGLTSITIPNSVTNIGNCAFYNCSGLTSVSIPNSVTSIGGCAFFRCTGLTSITIPNSVTKIGSSAFAGCSDLTTIISEIGNPFEIDNTVFDGIPSYTQLVVPKGTKAKYQETAGWNQFTNIIEVGDVGYVFEIDGINYKIGEDNTLSVTYKKAGYSSDVVIPSSVVYQGNTYRVTSIGDCAFYGCSVISITIPNSVTSIGQMAFYESFLTSITIPNSVTSIGFEAFMNCSSLTSVTIPNSVTSIDGHAFRYCSSLTSFVSEIENPFEIDESVFWGIPSDAQLVVPKGTKVKYQATAGWNQFSNIIEAGEEPDLPGQIHKDDIYFKVIGSGEAEVVSVEEGEKSVSIPSTISHNNTTYKVTSIAKEVFDNREYLAAVIWEPEAQFNAKVSNPNFLLYVKDEKYASHTVKNVVVNGVAENIELADAANGNDFYCPRAFTAKNISYSHNYQMETGLGESKGWETIVLPFDVQKYTHATKGELESFTTWSRSSNKKPFWLFELTADGYKDVAGIKANTPYIISMPNNRQYEQQYQIPGIVTFSATNVEVKKSDDMKPVSYQNRTFVPNYTNQNNLDYLLLNVNSNYVTYLGADAGSKFIGGLRNVHPFEAYMTTTDGTRSIDVMDGMTTAIKDIYMIPDDTEIIKVYDTKGVLVKTVKTNDGLRSGLAAGIYIVNGKKMIIK